MSKILEQIISLVNFEEAKCNDLIEFRCGYCNNNHFSKKSHIQTKIKESKSFIFCSSSCSSLYKYLYLGKPPTKEELERFISENLSSYEIGKRLNRSQGSIRHWLKTYNLKTNFKFKEGGYTHKRNIKIKQIDWNKVQEFYDSGKTWDDISKEFNISFQCLSRAKKLGVFKSRKAQDTKDIKNPQRIGRKHTKESKQKLSIARKQYLINNPDAKCWQKRHGRDSIPCKRVKELLTLNNIQFISEFEPLIEIGRFFSIDIAFPDKKVGIEINGRQHYESTGELKPYYKNRHDLIESNGWKLYEIPYHIAFNDKKMLELVNSVLLSENKLEFDYKLYQPKRKERYKRKLFVEKVGDNHSTKHKYPPVDELKILAASMRLMELEKLLNIPKKALWAYLNSRNIKTKRT